VTKKSPEFPYYLKVLSLFMRVVIALVTTVRMVVIEFVVAAANEPDRSCCG